MKTKYAKRQLAHALNKQALDQGMFPINVSPAGGPATTAKNVTANGSSGTSLPPAQNAQSPTNILPKALFDPAINFMLGHPFNKPPQKPPNPTAVFLSRFPFDDVLNTPLEPA